MTEEQEPVIMTEEQKLVLMLQEITMRYLQSRRNLSTTHGTPQEIYDQISEWFESKALAELASEVLVNVLLFGAEGTNPRYFLQECEDNYTFVISRSASYERDKAREPLVAKKKAAKKKAAKKKPSQATSSEKRSATTK